MNLKFLNLVLLTILVYSQGYYFSDQKIDYLTRLISKANQNALTYQLPKNAYEYYTKERQESKL